MSVNVQNIQCEVKTLPLLEALGKIDLPNFNVNLFVSEDWLKVLIQTYQLKLNVKYIEEDGKVSSWVIYSVVKNFLEWKVCLCSYCDYFDCYVQNSDHWHAFFQSIREDYPSYRIAIRNLRDNTVKGLKDFKLLSKEYYHIIDVEKDIDVLWKSLHNNFKGACQQAERKGVVIKPCSKEMLPEFFKLHLELRRKKYRLFPQPYRFFENIWNQYMDSDKGVMLGAFDPSGRFIAANVYLICGDTLYYKFSTSRLEKLDSRPNNLLIWHGIKFAKARGLKFIDLGSSGLHQDGLVFFKDHITSFSTKLEINHFGYSPPHYKYSQKIILGLWTKFCTHPWMPDGMVRFGSNIIYPYLA